MDTTRVTGTQWLLNGKKRKFTMFFPDYLLGAYTRMQQKDIRMDLVELSTYEADCRLLDAQNQVVASKVCNNGPDVIGTFVELLEKNA
jgi:hypothetical protein